MYKKFLIFVLAFVLFLGVFYVKKPQKIVSGALFNNVTHILYYDINETNLNYFKDKNITTVLNGDSFFVEIGSSEYDEALNNLNKPNSYAIKIAIDEKNKNKTINKIVKEYNLKTKFKEEIETATIIYGTSSKISDYIKVKGQKINLSIVATCNSVIIGYPIVLHSF